MGDENAKVDDGEPGVTLGIFDTGMQNENGSKYLEYLKGMIWLKVGPCFHIKKLKKKERLEKSRQKNCKPNKEPY